MKIKEIRRKRMYEAALQNMEKGKREGLYRKEIDSVILSKLHVFRIETMQDNDLFTQQEKVSLELFNEVFVYHLHGILSSAGKVFFEANFLKFKSSLTF
jgi:hypothetical protein